MSGPARTNLLVSLRHHTRLVVFLGLLAAYVATLVTTGDPSLVGYAGATVVVGGLLEHVAHRYVSADRPRRALTALSYVVLAASVAMSLFSIVWPHLRR